MKLKSGEFQLSKGSLPAGTASNQLLSIPSSLLFEKALKSV